MSRIATRSLAALVLLALAVAPAGAQEFATETYTLPNGMTVTLHEDHRLPTVVINTWFAVGSKDEAPGRTGFAHLFEHLMFMGTGRVPGNQFDVIMESGGGRNNASTSTDRTNYYSEGPASLLPTLLWLDADRLEALGTHMTQEKLDLQRDVVRNERRQSVENVPYGVAELIIPDTLYPEGHPYHHPIIGSHEDLEAASLEDVKSFFATYYVPGNASLVVAGSFDSAAVKEVILETFGAVPSRPVPSPGAASPQKLERELRRVVVDKVEFPKLILVWHSPRIYNAGDAEMDLLAQILAGGGSSRLERRLILETGLAQEVQAYQYSKELGSEFRIEALASPGTDPELLKREVLAALDALLTQGVGAEELQRAQATLEARFLRSIEDLGFRADRMNAYHHHFGTVDGFARDLDRWARVTPQGLQEWAARVLTEGRLDLRVLPEDARVAGADLDARPADFEPTRFEPPLPSSIELSGGVTVHALPTPGSGLFAGALLVDGGERLVPAGKAGLSQLLATLLTKGAAGRGAAEYAEALEALGAQVTAEAGRTAMTVRVQGLSSRLEPTLDLFADAILRADLTDEGIERERGLAVARIRARGDNPREVAGIVARAQTFGTDDVRGRPVEGYAATVEALTAGDLRGARATLLDPAGATFVFVGDFTLEGLRQELERRFGDWEASGEGVPAPGAPRTEAPEGKLVLVDRPGAPQTVIYLTRPVPAADDGGRALRATLNTLFGGSFTSRLNQNLRERNGYSYGAGSAFRQDGNQPTLIALSSVQTGVTGPALGEFKNEFDRLASGDVSPEEMGKAVKTSRKNLMDTASTTGSLLGTFAGFLAEGRPLDSVRRVLEALDGVDLKAVNTVAGSGLYEWDGLVVVLVGDREAVLPQLEAAGFPAPLLVDAEGRPLG